MPKVECKCDWCNMSVFRYPSQLKISKHVFCSPICRSKFISKKTNPEGYTKHPHLSEYNRENNRFRMTPVVRKKLSEARFGTGSGVGYLKQSGRHVHRTIAEQILGRHLRPGEIVHHKDGNKRNNSPDNLEILANQREHLRIHRQEWRTKRG